MPIAPPKIFISHSWDNKPLVRRLEAEIKAAGAEVWVDHAGVRGGDNLPKEISAALTQTQTVHGLGGVGKTQLALEYAYRYAVALVVLSIACASSPLIHKLDGRWTGTIEFPGLKTQVHVVFITVNQNLRGTMDIPRSRTAGLLLNDLEMGREGRMRFNLILPRDRQLHFIGEIRRDSIQGKITGADVAGRFFLHRARTQTESANAGPKDISWQPVQRDHWPTHEWKTGAPSQRDKNSCGAVDYRDVAN